REELEVLAHMGWHAGTIDEDEFQVVRNVIRLDEVSASEVMTPRTDIVAVPLGATIDEAADIMLREGHLRLPVYRDSLDHIEGVILGRDVWRAQREGVRDVRDVLRPVAFFPASKSVEELIPELRSRRHKMAIVVDEFGGTAGLITLEDLIEEIVGEIQDEHEDEPEPFTHLPGGRVRVWGAVSIRDANQELGLSLPDDDHDTLGGYIFGRLKRVGRVGDEIEVEGGRFRIARMRGRRIDSLIFTPDEDAGDD
ncbi:MAG: HlyC/CorC family transporter, partial [Gemmatimonadetes bacterium]